MDCRSCGVVNAPGRRYCRECGVRLGQPCTVCHFFNAVEDKHCGGCGHRLKSGARCGCRRGCRRARLCAGGCRGAALAALGNRLPPVPPSEAGISGQGVSQSEIDACSREHPRRGARRSRGGRRVKTAAAAAVASARRSSAMSAAFRPSSTLRLQGNDARPLAVGDLRPDPGLHRRRGSAAHPDRASARCTSSGTISRKSGRSRSTRRSDAGASAVPWSSTVSRRRAASRSRRSLR